MQSVNIGKNAGTKDNKRNINFKKIIAWVILILVVLLILFGIVQLFKTIFTKEKSVGNDANLKLVAESDNMVFYNKYDKGIVKIKSGKEYQITDELAYFLTVENDDIYYMTKASSTGCLIKKVKTNGESNETLKTVSTLITKFYIYNNYLYYATNENNNLGISKMSLDNGEESLIVSSNIQDLYLDNEILYYTDNAGYLRSINLDTNEISEISKENNIKKLQIYKNWIYFYDDTENALCKIKKDGSSKKIVSTLINSEIYNITNKYIYYFDSVNKQICRTDFNGKKSKAIVSLQASKTRINIADGILYYLDNTSSDSVETRMYRVKVNGNATDSIEY